MSELDNAGTVDLYAEEMTLGYILEAGRLADDAVMGAAVTALGAEREVFAIAKHRCLYDAMLALFGRGEPVNLPSVMQETHTAGTLQSIGGLEALLDLYQSVPDHVEGGFAENFRYWSGAVVDRARRRGLREEGVGIVKSADDPRQETAEIYNAAFSGISHLAESRLGTSASPIYETDGKMLVRTEERYASKKALLGLSSGFPELDMLLQGIQAGDLLIVAARPSVGKSAFLTSVAADVVFRQGVPALFFTLEMSEESISQRLAAMASKIPLSKLRSGSLSSEEMTRLVATIDSHEGKPFHLSTARTMAEILSESRTMKMRDPNLGLIVVDYLGYLEGARNKDNRALQVAEY